MRRRHFLQLGSAGLAACAAPALLAQARTPIKFTLDFRISGQVAPFFVALYKGYYAEEGLDVSFDVGNGSVAAITRVASGAYDMGFGDISALIEFNASQSAAAPLVQAVYQYYNRAPFAIIGRRDRGVSDFASLAGKRIAAAAVESTRRAWPMAARHAGVKADAFEWVTTDFSQRDNVIVRGDVDGATYFHDSAVSLFQRVPERELAVLSFADTGLALYGNAVLAATTLTKDRPDAVRGFLRATNRALLETLADPAAAMVHVKQREPMINEAVEAERFAITRRYVTAADTREHGLGGIEAAHLRSQLAEVARTFGLKNLPAVEGIFDPSFLPPAGERMLKA